MRAMAVRNRGIESPDEHKPMEHHGPSKVVVPRYN
jgi:hypothetical protein